ncbi:YidH family protein [Paenibacillus terreus]|uniref:YidH family protein n=1 Tax=Paenibacillus terreus TaxID=1387834 RepID=A0ABV5BBT5_9BACL
MTASESKAEENKEAKYVQQHLANERTFLAWVRTGIAIIGVGFIASGLTFGSSPYSRLAHTASVLAGSVSLLCGLGTIIFSALSYRRRRMQINSDQFRSTIHLVHFLLILMTVIGALLAVMMYVLLGKQGS